MGATVTLQLKVSGSPEPSVEWEHREGGRVWGEEVVTGGGVTALTLVDVRREEEGVYVCSAVNSLGCATMECQLTVLGESARHYSNSPTTHVASFVPWNPSLLRIKDKILRNVKNIVLQYI